MRNCNFETYNNSTSVLYICPNYQQCHGVLHGLHNKEAVRINEKPVYDTNGYVKYRKLPHLTIGPLTNPCDCGPQHYTSIEESHPIFDNMLQMTNVSRKEFTNLANSYFAVAGEDNCKFKDTGNHLTWTCLQCKRGCLQLAVNRNPTMQPSKYQSYGTISIAIPCKEQCKSHTSSMAAKTIWLPKSHTTQEMAMTTEQIQKKKERNNEWVKEVCTIAKQLLTKQHMEKKK